METARRILAGDWFSVLAMPVGVLSLAVLLRVNARPDRLGGYKVEDVAVGFDLMIIGAFGFVGRTIDIAVRATATRSISELRGLTDRLLVALVVGIAMISSMFAVAYAVRRHGYEEGQETLSLGIGVMLPILTGLLFLLFATSGIGR